jgi:UDP-N-acetylmuramate: L-alanyl-gamma-D-glutamyl-meso-diaminopimelate ligase
MRVHFIGIGGTGMGSLAGLLKAAGHDVRGSDENLYPPMSDQLRDLGIPVMIGFGAKNLDWGPERVVVGNVCSKDHPEVVAANERKLPLTSFPAILEELFLTERHALVVAGTHGKTTTSSLLAATLVDAGLDPSFLIGGVPQNFGHGFRLGQGREFVVEGDEYDSAFFDKGSKFLHYRPRTAIVTSVELDHVDIFASLDAVRATFEKFVALVPPDGLVLAAASSAEALRVAKQSRARVETYAAGARAIAGVTPMWQALVTEEHPSGRTTFDVMRAGERFGTFRIALAGEYNIENALAVIAAGASLGLSPETLARALSRFRGVKRRQEVRGVAAGVTVIDDYGHHPTAIRETLAALRKRHGRGKLVAIYEPRSATSRRKTFQAEFVDAFGAADEVVIAKLFAPEKIPPAERFDPERLAADLRGNGTSARMIPEVPAIVENVVERVQPGDCVVVFSSGGFDGIHDKLLQRLGFPVRPAAPEDMGRIRDILEKTGLETVDAPDDVLVVDSEGVVAGCVCVEGHDEAAILRSLAVHPDQRGNGFGWMLADHAVQRARALGAQRLYLLTDTATDFFAEKFGFRPVDRALVDAQIVETEHFRASAKTAIAMRLDL